MLKDGKEEYTLSSLESSAKESYKWHHPYEQVYVWEYVKCCKTSNTSCLPNRPRKTAQTQIRLLLSSSSLIRIFPVYYFDKHFE